MTPIGANVVLMLIIVYSIGLLVFYTMPNIDEASVQPLRIHLQTSPIYELELLPGIGPTMAKRIIEYRKTHELNTADDLLGVHGIGQRKVDYLRWMIATKDEKK